ncbi:MAG: AMP-binding protein [Oscillospiraceae bacterium]|nr:AMP-binding protein [Oscillospiraceae bacterium]
MLKLYDRYIDETFDADGILTGLQLHCPDTYNFAFDIVDKRAEDTPDAPALMWVNEAGEERRFTFGEIKTYSDKAANLLAGLGVKKGDKVMLILKRHYQFWFALTACHKIGAVAIPATHLLTARDVVYRCTAADISGIICTADDDIAAHVDAALPECPSVRFKMMAFGSERARTKGLPDGWQNFDEELENAPAGFARGETSAHDPMLLYFTSGTTGHPKMVWHDQTYSLGHISTARHWHNCQPGGLHLTVADTGWAKAVWGKYYGQWIMGSAIFVYDYDRFHPAEMLNILSKYKVTTFCAPPTIFRFFIQEDLSNFNLSCLQYVTTAGEALNPEVYNRFLEGTGLKMMEGFGQTECTVLVFNSVGMTARPGSMGRPNPQYIMDIVDENGQPVPPGTTGEIVVHTDREKPFGLFLGYYRDEALTDRVWHGGLYHTGDTAWKDEDGYYWYVGRTDDIIKSSGYRIGPFEIESVLMEHPAVMECAITGVPDPIRGQVVKATVVLAKGYMASEELKKELQEHVKKQTAPYKYPRVIEFVAELPKTISGKIRRVEIREGDGK